MFLHLLNCLDIFDVDEDALHKAEHGYIIEVDITIS